MASAAAGCTTKNFPSEGRTHENKTFTAADYKTNPPTSGNPGLQSVMTNSFGNNYYPPNIGLAVHGHVHDFQALDFSSNHPATFVAGNGGDNLDTALPATFNRNDFGNQFIHDVARKRIVFDESIL